MNISFRQFLEDIEIDTTSYSPKDADEYIETAQRSVDTNARDNGTFRRHWRTLNVKFPHAGFKVIYRKDKGTYAIALIDTRDLSGVKVPVGLVLPRGKNRIVAQLVAEKRSVELLTKDGRYKTLQGLQTTLLSGARDYRGSGIAHLLYEALVDHGQVLFSSDIQTPGGKSVWQQITQNMLDRADVGVIAHSSSLVQDTWPKMNRCAYANRHNFWVVAPAGTFNRYVTSKYR